MTGESVSDTGCTNRPTDPIVAVTSRVRRNGWRADATAKGSARETPARSAPVTRRASNPSDSCTSPMGPDAAGLHPGSGSGTSRSECATVSNKRKARREPPMPSVSEWWTFMTSAARSPSRPSMSVNRHSGRVRSKPVMASIRA